MTREGGVGPTQSAARASGNDDLGDDVVMREYSADDDRAGQPSLTGSDIKRRIATKMPREDTDVRTSTTEQHVPRRISGKM